MVIEHILKQHLKPSLRVIVDDNSSDNTFHIIKKFADKISWIEPMKFKRESNEYDTEIGYSKVVSAGIDYAKKLAKNRGIQYNYIGILDADILLDENYFSNLVKVAEEIDKIGIISGVLYSPSKKDDKSKDPRGGARLFHKKCLEDIGGYPITAAPDTVTNIKARNRGWKLLKVENAIGTQLREPWAGISLWHGYKNKGKGRYYLCYHPVNAILTGIFLLCKFPFYPGLAFMHGYFSSFIKKEVQTEDKEIRDYFYNESLRELKHKLIKKLRLSGDKLRGKTERDNR